MTARGIPFVVHGRPAAPTRLPSAGLRWCAPLVALLKGCEGQRLEA